MKRAPLLLLMGIAGLAVAQSTVLVDPTRPPSAGGESNAKESAPPRGPKLQSVLISPTRRVAVISGDTVMQGGKYGSATVVAITESAVLLRYADHKETLWLIPAVVKRKHRAGAAAHSVKGNAK